MDFQVIKGRDGYRAESYIELPGIKTKAGDADSKTELRISTYKSRKGIVSIATVGAVKGGAFSTVLFGDFHVAVREMPGRCTEKAVRQEHTYALAELDALKAKIAAFYVKAE